MPDREPLTDEEIHALFASGDLSLRNSQLLHPDELKVFNKLQLDSMMNLMPGGGGGLQALGQVAEDAIPAVKEGLGALKKGWNATVGPAVGGAGAVAGKAVAGYPGMWAGWRGGNALGAKLKFAEGAAEAALPSKLELLQNPSKYGHLTDDQVQQILGTAANQRIPSQKVPVGPRRVTPGSSVIDEGPSAGMNGGNRGVRVEGANPQYDTNSSTFQSALHGPEKPPSGPNYDTNSATFREAQYGPEPPKAKPVQPRRPEFAPGNTNKTPPSTYVANENKFAESQGDQGSVDRARQMLEDTLNATGESSKGYARQGGMPAEPKAKPVKRRSPK